MNTSTLSSKEQRTYRETHPWIDFQVDLTQAPYTLWMLLGEAQSKCQHIAGVPLRPESARKLYEIYLSKGAHATTSIEGNTLSEDQVQQQIEGKLRLPKSQQYLATEVQNILDAYNQIAKDLLSSPSRPITPELICQFNALVLRGLEVEEGVEPGAIRKHPVGVGTYRGAPWEDCSYLVEELCRWLNSEFFVAPGEDLKFAFAMLKSVLAHLYIAWIHPFGDGNGRTARLIEFLVLVQSGVPLPAGHLLSNHYNKTRTRYYLELDRSSKSRDGVIRFIEYSIEGFVDGLKEQLDYIRDRQWRVTWENYVHDLFKDKDTLAGKRQKHLVLDMPETPAPRRALPLVSARVASEYAGKGEKTVTRDINFLMKMNLIIKKDKGFAPNRSLILAFLPPRREGKPEEPESPEGMLF